MFKTNNEVHEYNNRHASSFHISQARTKFTLDTIVCTGPRFWNSLDSNITHAVSISVFSKHKLKSYLLSKYKHGMWSLNCEVHVYKHILFDVNSNVCTNRPPPPLPFGLACVLVPCSVLSCATLSLASFPSSSLSLLLSYQGSCFPRVTFCKYISHFLVHLSHLFSLVNMKLLLLTWHEGPYFTSIAFTKVSSSFFSTIIYTVLLYYIVLFSCLHCIQ